MAKALRNYAATPIHQGLPLNNRQVINNQGGYVYETSLLSRLERFLILGTDGGTYYTSEKDITSENVTFLRNAIKEDPILVLNTVVDISTSGRAYRNTPAIFAMAMLLNEAPDFIKTLTRKVVPEVARTGTMIFELAEFIDKLGGWGPAKVKAIRGWFESKTPDQLAFQAVKYRQRNGWKLADLMRLSHPKDVDTRVGNFILGKDTSFLDEPDIIDQFRVMQAAPDVKAVVSYLKKWPNLPWETIPTQFLTDDRVWKQLFQNGLSGQALLRNVTRFAKMGSLNDMVFAREFAGRLTDESMISRTRLHPMQYLNAYGVYTRGARRFKDVARESLTRDWKISPVVKDALDDGFGLAFGNIEPSNKRTMISVDISASMGWNFAGQTSLTAAEAAGALSLITARVEPFYVVNGFSTSLIDLGFSSRTSIEESFKKVLRSNFGGTDCSLPMIDALRSGRQVDTFIVITDNETRHGSVHPCKALQTYRQSTGIDAKLAVMAMTPTKFSIADPLDRGMLDVVGFDSNTPKIISEFSAGRI